MFPDRNRVIINGDEIEDLLFIDIPDGNLSEDSEEGEDDDEASLLPNNSTRPPMDSRNTSSIRNQPLEPIVIVVPIWILMIPWMPYLTLAYNLLMNLYFPSPILHNNENVVPPVHTNVVSMSPHSNEVEEVPDETLRRPGALNLVWRKSFNTPAVSEFNTETGPTLTEGLSEPTEYFTCIFPDHLVELIVFPTNLYATQKQKPFTPTTSEEIKIFLAINMIMGIKRQPSYKDYWSSKPILRDDFISSLMSLNRFSWLLGNFHLSDNNMMPRRDSPEYDKLYKVRSYLNILSSTFETHYNPTEHISIDESMIKFKGRSTFKQYMPKKPIKRGYKVWIRANESGYISEFQIYTGKVDSTETGLGKRVVKDLTSKLGPYHKVYFDNYFSSVELVKDLQERNIYACGVIQKKRKHLPKLKPEKNLKRVESDWLATNDGISHCVWKDNKNRTTVDRLNKDGSTTTISCPEIVKDYNKHMGYVDKADGLKSYYELKRRSVKWWPRIFWHFVNVSVVNAFILYSEDLRQIEAGGTGKIDLKNFKLCVAQGLIGAVDRDKTDGRRKSNSKQNKYKIQVPLECRFDKAQHMPVKGNRRRCAFCSTKSEPHVSRWACDTCKVGLCLDQGRSCFKLFHKK